MLHLQDKFFSFDELASLSDDVILSFKSSQFVVALQFCKQWLNGQQEFVFNTSGSTGTPKTIVITRTKMEASAQGTIAALHLQSNEKIYVCLNTAMIGGAMMLVRGLLLGAQLTIAEPVTLPLENISTQHDYTFASFVPAQLASLLSDDGTNLQKLNRFTNVLIGGAGVHPLLKEQLSKSTASIWHTYGMTETVSHIALKKINEEQYTTLPGTIIQTDERGCLMIKSAVTNQQWITTNDLVNIHPDQSFILLGRVDDVINTGGKKFFASAIENLIGQTYSSTDYFVTSLPHPVWGEQIVAVFEGHVPSETHIQLIAKQISESLSPHAVPKQFLAIPSLVRTPSGKINKPESKRLLLI